MAPRRRGSIRRAGEPLRSWLGWTPLLRTPSSGVWLFRGALRGEHLPFCACVHSGLGFSGHLPHCLGGRAALSLLICVWAEGSRGPQTGARSWELLRDLWRTIAPHMAPWCAVGDVPKCANLNYYGGSGSRVRWHSDYEVLFGGRGESKLIVSVSGIFSVLLETSA